MSIVPVFGVQTVTILCTIDYLTKSFGDEIMGWKEEKREQGWSEEDIAKGIRQAQEALEAEGGSPSLEAIKKRISEEWATGTPAELKVVNTASEPLVKFGHEAREEKTYPVQTSERGAVHPSNQNETHFA